MVDLVRHNMRRGTAAVEAALMLPLVMFLTFALLTYGWIFIKSGQINNAARQGARVAARADAEFADVQAIIDTLMANAEISGYIVDPLDVQGSPAGTIMTVTITVPYAGTDVELISMPLFMPVPQKLKSVASMLKEGLAG
ncbi:MAG: TadE/TadG family type IV pilus assembly protein [Planctomycetota bacterium]|nr:TadE/TadG family type IV pilus assembly protein [Planctomycetota bacterium]